MGYNPDEYSKWYIEQAFFKLLNEYEYDKISVTDIATKAGVGRATFYRYFKNKEEVLTYYFKHNANEFVINQRFYPRCRQDYIQVVSKVLALFRQHAEPFKLIRKARLEHIYLDFLNQNLVQLFQSDYPDKSRYTPYLYAGMLFNVSMAWLDGGCAEPIEMLADMIVSAIYFE